MKILIALLTFFPLVSLAASRDLFCSVTSDNMSSVDFAFTLSDEYPQFKTAPFNKLNYTISLDSSYGAILITAADDKGKLRFESIGALKYGEGILGLTVLVNGKKTQVLCVESAPK